MAIPHEASTFDLSGCLTGIDPQRREAIIRILDGQTIAEAAHCLLVTPADIRRWWHQFMNTIAAQPLHLYSPATDNRPADGPARAVPAGAFGVPEAPGSGERVEHRAARGQGVVEGLLALKDGLRRGEATAVERQHQRNKLTARERVDLLLDEGTFVELGMLRRHRAQGFGMDRKRPHGDGVVTGWGYIDGRQTFVFAHDFTVFGGALGEAFAAKIHKILDLAASTGVPIVGLNDGAGARIQEGVAALAGYGGIFTRNVHMSGVVPQVSVVAGPCAGGAAYSPALTDFVFMVDGIANMYLTGPDVVRTVIGEKVTHEELGGATVHASRSGVADFISSDEHQCLEDVRCLLSFLPANNLELPPRRPPTDDATRRCPDLTDIVPADPAKSYDIRDVIAEIVDHAEFLEVGQRWAPNVVCGFARLDGHPVGIVANQPVAMAGTIDISASEKAARFVSTCDSFNISLVTLVDVPGFLPGTVQEHGGIIRHGAKLLYAYCQATVPRIQLVLRKAYGGAYIVMDSKGIGADLSFAWPSNEIAVMGAEAAVEIIFRKDLAGRSHTAERRTELAAHYRRNLMHPYHAAEMGYIDEVIAPTDTRRILIGALDCLRSKQDNATMRKHRNPSR